MRVETLPSVLPLSLVLDSQHSKDREKQRGKKRLVKIQGALEGIQGTGDAYRKFPNASNTRDRLKKNRAWASHLR